jgi:hypothetical protein
MSRSALNDVKIFSNLCGQKAMPNVVVVTTMWSQVRKEIGVKREEQLKNDFWNDMLADGCRTERFGDTRESAWAIVGKRSYTVLSIQEEMSEVGKSLPDTKAGFYAKDVTPNVSEGLMARFRRFFSR